MTALAAGYELIIFDLDGVVYVGAEAIPGVPRAITDLVSAGVEVAYATNNASRRGAQVAELLRGLGVPARAEHVLTSAEAAARLLATRLPAGAPVLVVGAPALRAEISDVGLAPVDDAATGPVAVAQGYGPHVGWAELAEASVAIRAGAWWVVTNTDPTLPSARGPLPGNGALVAALATALGRGPDQVVGKPEPELFLAAARRRPGARALVVGDRLDTDIEGAIRAGLESLLVLTGVTEPADLLAAPVGQRPTYVAAGLSGLSADDRTVRVPVWDCGSGTAVTERWRVRDDGGRLRLDGDGDAVSALRVLAAAVWAAPDPIRIEPGTDAAARALTDLGIAGSTLGSRS